MDSMKADHGVNSTKGKDKFKANSAKTPLLEGTVASMGAQHTRKGLSLCCQGLRVQAFALRALYRNLGKYSANLAFRLCIIVGYGEMHDQL